MDGGWDGEGGVNILEWMDLMIRTFVDFLVFLLF